MSEVANEKQKKILQEDILVMIGDLRNLSRNSNYSREMPVVPKPKCERTAEKIKEVKNLAVCSFNDRAEKEKNRNDLQVEIDHYKNSFKIYSEEYNNVLNLKKLYIEKLSLEL